MRHTKLLGKQQQIAYRTTVNAKINAAQVGTGLSETTSCKSVWAIDTVISLTVGASSVPKAE